MSDNLNANQAGKGVAEEPEGKFNPQEFYPRDVATFLRGIMLFLGEQAWIYMGLTLHPIQGKITKDLSQARLAVNSMESLLLQLSGYLAEGELSEFRKMLADLKLNFVSQSAREEEKPEEKAPAAPEKEAEKPEEK